MSVNVQERRLELSHAVNRVSDAILRGDASDQVLQSLIDIAGPTLDADHALIYDVRFEAQVAVALCEWLRPGSNVSPTKATYPLSLFATAVREFERDRMPLESSRHAIHQALAADGADVLLHEHKAIQRLLWYPFRLRPDGAYLLVFNQVSHDREWTDEELDFLNVVASQANLALMKLDMLREHERIEADLRRSETRFRLFYDSTPSMFFTVDRAGKVRSVNTYATQHLGYSAAELLDANVLKIVHPDDRNDVTRHLAACFHEPGLVRELSFRKICKDGSIMWVKETTRVADGPDGMNALIVCDDITEARAHEEAARRAESKAHDRDEFMAMLGHELRNPLAPIVTALEILRRRGRNDDELELIDRQVSHLRRLVDDLLDVSRITRGMVELQMEPIEVSDVVAQAIEVARPLFQGKRQRLHVSVPDEGLLVLADPSRLVQGLSNLLTNAAKFSGIGQSVHIIAERRGDRIVIRVLDHGEGIEPEMLDRVFDLFVQRGQAADRPQSGLGLGLTIVRNLITLHGGTVRATSDGRGCGTTLVVDLPAAAHSALRPARMSGRPRPSAAAASARNVLVVDDNEDVRKSLCRLLDMHGYRTVGVGDGPSALAAAAELQPRTILVDIGLPGMDGYEFARQLRRTSPEGPQLVAITGYGQPSDRAQSRDAGFVAHLVKPVDIDTLLPLLEIAT